MIPKIALPYLSKQFHDVIIILVSNALLNLKNVKKKEENYKSFNFSRTKGVFSLNKRHFWGDHFFSTAKTNIFYLKQTFFTP